MQIFGWRDDLSGVSEYELEVYQMEYSVASGKLVLPDRPVRMLTWQGFGATPTIELRNAGVYFACTIHSISMCGTFVNLPGTRSVYLSAQCYACNI